MKNCPYCGQQNPGLNRFCNKCGSDMSEIPTSVNPKVNSEKQETNYARYEVHQKSALEKGIVKFILYLYCIFIPLVGLILGLLVSLTPFQNQKELSSKLLTCAGVSGVVWLILCFCTPFIIGFLVTVF